MAFSSVEFPEYPTVPDADGVPPLVREPGSASTSQTNETNISIGGTDDSTTGSKLATQDVNLPSGSIVGTQWGIFDKSGKAVISPDSCVSFEMRKERRVPDYQIEDGGFASYNKVAVPFEPKIIMTKGGTEATRTAFITQMDVILNSLDLYTVVTPTVTYPSVNVVFYSYQRNSSKGAQLLTFEVALKEIRIVNAAAFTNSKSPDAASPVNGATVTPTDPTANQTTSQQNNDAANITAPTTSVFA